MSTTLIKHPESIQLVALCLSMVEAEIKGGDTKSWVEQAGDFLIKIRDEDIVPLGEVLVDLAVLAANLLHEWDPEADPFVLLEPYMPK